MLLNPFRNPSVKFTEVNPDKGTETLFQLAYATRYPFTEVNPDKGTETLHGFLIQLLLFLFTEVNPDKGTETRHADRDSQTC